MKEKFCTSNALLSVVLICTSFFFSTYSLATSDTYSAIYNSVATAEQNDTQIGVDGDGPSDMPLSYQFAINLLSFSDASIMFSEDNIPCQANHFISVRAPPHFN